MSHSAYNDTPMLVTRHISHSSLDISQLRSTVFLNAARIAWVNLKQKAIHSWAIVCSRGADMQITAPRSDHMCWLVGNYNCIANKCKNYDPPTTLSAKMCSFVRFVLWCEASWQREQIRIVTIFDMQVQERCHKEVAAPTCFIANILVFIRVTRLLYEYAI